MSNVRIFEKLIENVNTFLFEILLLLVFIELLLILLNKLLVEFLSTPNLLTLKLLLLLFILL
jgi:hypothetical protein